MKILLTKEGKKKIQDELDFLNTSEKTRIINELSDSRDRGGVEENAEYTIAKEEYDKLLIKISKLQQTIINSTIINSDNILKDRVSILSVVRVLNIGSKKEITFNIVPENEIDIKLGKISPNSPIGSGLLGKKEGDICKIITPSGVLEFEILEIGI